MEKVVDPVETLREHAATLQITWDQGGGCFKAMVSDSSRRAGLGSSIDYNEAIWLACFRYVHEPYQLSQHVHLGT